MNDWNKNPHDGFSGAKWNASRLTRDPNGVPVAQMQSGANAATPAANAARVSPGNNATALPISSQALKRNSDAGEGPSSGPRKKTSPFAAIMPISGFSKKLLRNFVKKKPCAHPTQPTVKPGLTTKKFRLKELYKTHSVEQRLDKGDVLVFVDYPDGPRDGPKYVDCLGTAYRSHQFRVHSGRLRATGSSKFAEMLDPKYQTRVRRQRKMTNALPDGVRYLLDLTPPLEGDDLVFQMTRLSLTPGIIKWWNAYRFQEVDDWRVTGHDDVCTCCWRKPPVQAVQDGVKKDATSASDPATIKPANVSPRSFPQTGSVSSMSWAQTERETADDEAFLGNIPDYCPIRHRNSIIRLLMMMEGDDIALDSASRVWSLVATAVILDCTLVVRAQVARWILHGNNKRFIEILPEESLRIGFDLKLVQITQCAFRILVNELAMDQVADQPPEHNSARYTIFGRRRGYLNDELSNMVQHAAHAFSERMSALSKTCHDLDPFGPWLGDEWFRVKEMARVLAQEKDALCERALESLGSVMGSIALEVTSALDKIPSEGTLVSERLYPSMDSDRRRYVEPEEFKPLKEIMPSLNEVQRLMCPFLYQEIDGLWERNMIVSWDEAAEGIATWASYLSTIDGMMNDVHQFLCLHPEKLKSEDWHVFLKEGNDDKEALARRMNNPLISLARLDQQLRQTFEPILFSWVRQDIKPALDITRHLLLTLTKNEMRFLPVWAGGCDDGTGSVFAEVLPPAPLGPDGPGPGYHTGTTISSDSSSASTTSNESDLVALMEVTLRLQVQEESTVVGSMDAQDGISTSHAPDEMIADLAGGRDGEARSVAEELDESDFEVLLFQDSETDDEAESEGEEGE